MPSCCTECLSYVVVIDSYKGSINPVCLRWGVTKAPARFTNNRMGIMVRLHERLKSQKRYECLVNRLPSPSTRKISELCTNWPLWAKFIDGLPSCNGLFIFWHHRCFLATPNIYVLIVIFSYEMVTFQGRITAHLYLHAIGSVDKSYWQFKDHRHLNPMFFLRLRNS